ncbi:hypothetical protein JB92DRAFT_2829584 [Gautieria morchelliformis]|nr:hypothetical protein JB92DRAFT_2829584 [Gautieria morchelliformis]
MYIAAYTKSIGGIQAPTIERRSRAKFGQYPLADEVLRHAAQSVIYDGILMSTGTTLLDTREQENMASADFPAPDKPTKNNTIAYLGHAMQRQADNRHYILHRSAHTYIARHYETSVIHAAWVINNGIVATPRSSVHAGSKR